MIKINKIDPFTCEAFYNEDSLGFLNEYEFNDLRIQIKRNKAEGFYMLHNGEKILIHPSGKCSSWPVGFYDLIENQLADLI